MFSLFSIIFIFFHVFFINYLAKRRLRHRIDVIFMCFFMIFQYFLISPLFFGHLFWQKAPAAKNRLHVRLHIFMFFGHFIWQKAPAAKNRWHTYIYICILLYFYSISFILYLYDIYITFIFYFILIQIIHLYASVFPLLTHQIRHVRISFD